MLRTGLHPAWTALAAVAALWAGPHLPSWPWDRPPPAPAAATATDPALAALQQVVVAQQQSINFLGMVAHGHESRIAALEHPGPSPSPPPGPTPAPAPVPPPAPTPSPAPVPVPLAAKLYAVAVYDPASGTDASRQAADVRASVLTSDPRFAALNVEWRSWPTDAPAIDRLGIRGHLPDASRLPCLLVYTSGDGGHFYRLDGTTVPKGTPEAQPHPSTVDALLAGLRRLRGVADPGDGLDRLQGDMTIDVTPVTRSR